MKLTIKDLDFKVIEADLSAEIKDPNWCDAYNEVRWKDLSWGLSFQAEEKEVGREYWAPRIYGESLSFPVHHWKDLVGKSVEWNRAFNNNGEPNGGFYVFEHEDIPFSILRVTRRRGTKFKVIPPSDRTKLW